MNVRRLERGEIGRVWEIDRSEVHHHVYRMRDGGLVLTPFYFEIKGWRPGQREKDGPMLGACAARGGVFVGMFDGDEKIVGVAVVDAVPRGAAKDRLQLVKLYVSRDVRGRGVGTRLFEEARSIAREAGAHLLYVSATPTQNTVEFYLRRGCRLADPPDPELLALEPDDIHLVCPV
jgi:GNAT superfamily N-acetyltransferase